jgi:hypothetical protein
VRAGCAAISSSVDLDAEERALVRALLAPAPAAVLEVLVVCLGSRIYQRIERGEPLACATTTCRLAERARPVIAAIESPPYRGDVVENTSTQRKQAALPQYMNK